jgi:hypothetical protein
MVATAERGARFLPTVGVATPNGFTTSHPRAETTISRDLRLSVCQCPGAKVAIPSCLRSLTLRNNSRVPLASAPPPPRQSFQPYALSPREVACGTISLALIRPDVPTDGRLTLPSLIKTSAYQSASH